MTNNHLKYLLQQYGIGPTDLHRVLLGEGIDLSYKTIWNVTAGTKEPRVSTAALLAFGVRLLAAEAKIQGKRIPLAEATIEDLFPLQAASPKGNINSPQGKSNKKRRAA